MNLINFAQPLNSGLSVVIGWLVKISSSIAVGVILFTVILKLITLPFDFFSRVKMRKNSLKMEAMRPELEKLQKQYANDKTLYNQKMMALYKKNGYSMWGSCLPTIITLVIFIVAINAFTSYSEFQNREYFYNMSISYNNAVYSGLEQDDNLIKTENGTYKIVYDKLIDEYNKDNGYNALDAERSKVKISETETLSADKTTKTYTRVYRITTHVGDRILERKDTDGKDVKIILNNYKITERKSTVTATLTGDKYVLNNDEVFADKSQDLFKNYQMSLKTENSYVEHIFNYNYDKNSKFVLDSHDTFNVLADKLPKEGSTIVSPVACADNNNLKVKIGEKSVYYGEEYVNYRVNEYIDNYNKSVEEFNKKVDKGKEDGPKKELIKKDDAAKKAEIAATYTETYFLKEICQEKSAEYFRNIGTGFLWVKNIWVTDSPMKHPIVSDWDEFKSTYKYESGVATMNNEAYQQLIAKLDHEKSTPNGYFILAILTAGISFLTQFVMSKAQKSQMELQTVDGQGARTQKMMMWIMPIMMAFFAFMYTAAFSIYMILSSVISIVTTLGINWIVGKKFAKKEKANDDGKVRGRIHVEEEPPKPAKKEKTKKEKPAKNNGDDFIKGDGATKHIRGRLK